MYYRKLQWKLTWFLEDSFLSTLLQQFLMRYISTTFLMPLKIRYVCKTEYKYRTRIVSYLLATIYEVNVSILFSM